MNCAGHVTCIGKRNLVYMNVVGNPERKRPLGRPGLDKRIITSGFSGCGLRVMEYIDLAQDRYRRREIKNAVMNFGFH
jgi:hypothetical protein